MGEEWHDLDDSQKDLGCKIEQNEPGATGFEEVVDKETGKSKEVVKKLTYRC